MSSDAVQKLTSLQAPLKRVWSALAESAQLGSWFGMRFDGPFRAGARVRGMVVPITVDPEVARAQEKYAGPPCEITIEQAEPQRVFSFRRHPHALDSTVDYSDEPTTLIVFVFEEVAGGIKPTVTESGFDQIPLERRAKAFSANEQGCGMVAKLVQKYVGVAA